VKSSRKFAYRQWLKAGGAGEPAETGKKRKE
jgi:hypothetical protein